MNRRTLKYVPFSKSLNAADKGSLAILTGSQGWTRGKSPSHWYRGRRLLLPFNEEPESFKWPVSGRDCIIFGFGESEPREKLVRLATALLSAGADRVTWQGQWHLTVYGDGLSDAALAAGPLSEIPAPIFKPARAPQ